MIITRRLKLAHRMACVEHMGSAMMVVRAMLKDKIGLAWLIALALLKRD